MADTLPNIHIPQRTWVDLYAASGIAVGTQITVTLVSGFEALLCTKATQPTDLSAYDPLVDTRFPLTNKTGDSGAWCYTRATNCVVTVKET